MAHFDENLDGLFIQHENAKKMYRDKEARAIFNIKYVSEDFNGFIKFYSLNSDLLVVSKTVDENIAYISNNNCYGSGDSLIRFEISKFIDMESNNGIGSDLIIKDEKLPFEVEYEFPYRINRDPI